MFNYQPAYSDVLEKIMLLPPQEKKKYMDSGHLSSMGYKYLSSFKRIDYKLLLIKIRKTSANLKCFTLIQVFNILMQK